MASRALWNRLFALWTVTGVVFVVFSLVCYDQCPEQSFYTTDDAEKQIQAENYGNLVAWLCFLAIGSLVYGYLGVFIFLRRGCVVFLIAGIVVVICAFAWLDALWAPL